MKAFLQLTFQGLALGSIYALIALGFVVVWKATRVLNLAMGDLMLLGAYLVYSFRNQLGVPFTLSALIAMALMALVGWGIERTVLRRMVGQPVFAIVMITVGLSIVLHQIVTIGWGFRERTLGDPWGASAFRVAGLRLNTSALFTILMTSALLTLLFLVFRRTRIGLAMRATALDQEAAMSVGIPIRAVFAASWAIAAVTATVAGVFIASFPSSLHPGLSFSAFRALPAAILGGLDSLGGAVVGGLLIGVVEIWVQGYQPRYAPWLGTNFYLVASYVVMFGVFMIRPHGLFGTGKVVRL